MSTGLSPEQKAVFVKAQAALLNAEVAKMQAENQHCMNCGNAIAYADSEFEAVITKYEATIGYNAVLALFTGD